jgi:hypothetical protein
MNAIPDSEKAIKKSLSFPPELWAFVIDYAGDTGNPSRVVQKAVRMLQEASNHSKDQSKKAVEKGINEVRKARKQK